MQHYKDIDGYMVRDLKNSSKYPNNPDSKKLIQDFDIGSENEESFGTRVFGYFKPPNDGAYTFSVCKYIVYWQFITGRNQKVPIYMFCLCVIFAFCIWIKLFCFQNYLVTPGNPQCCNSMIAKICSIYFEPPSGSP